MNKAEQLMSKMTELQTHLDSISNEEFEEFVDLVFSVGQNEDPTTGMKHRYEAEAFARQLIKSLASNPNASYKII